MDCHLKTDEVFLQPDVTKIRRKGKVNIETGKIKLEIVDLDPSLNPDQLSLIISGEELIIHQLNFKKKEQEINSDVVALQALIKSNERSIDHFEDSVADLNKEIEPTKFIYNEIQTKLSIGIARSKVSFGEYNQIYDQIKNFFSSKEKLKKELEEEIRRLQKENSNLQKDLDSITSKTPDSGILEVNIESEKDQEIELQLEYVVSRCSWHTFYELHYDTMTDKKECAMVKKWVEITNSTNEVWQDVIVTVTDKLRTDLSIDEPKITYMDPEKGIESDFLIPVQSVTLPNRVSIVNDPKKPAKFELEYEKITNVDFFYYWNATDLNDVVEIMILSFDNYFYPSKINVFIDGNFADVLDHINFSLPNEEIGFPVRQANQILTSKKSISKKVLNAGMLKKHEEKMYNYQLDVENQFKNDIKLVIYDSIPEPYIPDPDSKNVNALNVDYAKISTTPYKVFKNGLVRWDLDLKSKESKRIDFTINLIKGE